MINWDKIINKVGLKTISIIMGMVFTLILISYIIILCKYIQKNDFANSVIEITEKNEQPTFSINKIYLCSSANAIDNSLTQNLENLDVYQYTDIAIYINNKTSSEKLTNKNTIKELYIDNISIKTTSNLGEQSLQYTNLLKTGSADIANQSLQSDRIDFNIVNNNKENETANYDMPTFYADCSNPITLKYLNKNIYTNYSVEKGTSASFNGTLLQKLGIKVEDINCKVKFKINIVNNDEDYYSCWINFKIPLDDIYNGTTIKSTKTSGIKYNFFTL